MAFAGLKLPVILFGAAQLLKHAARRHPAFKAGGPGDPTASRGESRPGWALEEAVTKGRHLGEPAIGS